MIFMSFKVSPAHAYITVMWSVANMEKGRGDMIGPESRRGVVLGTDGGNRGQV